MRNIRMILTSVAGLFVFACAGGGHTPPMSQASATPSLDGGLPAPTGPYRLGRGDFTWTDSSRAEVASSILLGSAGKAPTIQRASGSRRIGVDLWYPAEPPRGEFETAPYNPELDAFVPLLNDPELIAAQRGLRTAAALNAAVSKRAGRLPVVLFSPGGGMFASDYTALAQDIASHGYLVSVVSHPGVTLMRRTEASVSAEWDGWKPPPDLKMGLDRASLEVSSAFFEKRDRVLAADLSFVLDELAKLNTSADFFLKGRVDLDRVAVIGHSTGGAAAAMAAELDPRIDALVVLDVLLPRTMFGAAIRTPILLMRTEGVGYPPGWNEAMVAPFAALEDTGYDVVVHGARHQSFSDRPFQRPGRFGDPASSRLVSDVTSLYVRQFLDRYLREISVSPPTGKDAPDAVVATVYPAGKPAAR